MMIPEDIQQDLRQLLAEFVAAHALPAGGVFVVGCSTSEVIGERIGKMGSPEVAAAIYPILVEFAAAHELHLAFQCCEHLNRALVLGRPLAVAKGYEEVAVVPHPRAGGSLASHAYRHLPEAVVVESIAGDAGIDIGETMIGMHLKAVVVPLRLAQRTVGKARTGAAYCRPKLIGGERTQYTL